MKNAIAVDKLRDGKKSADFITGYKLIDTQATWSSYNITHGSTTEHIPYLPATFKLKRNSLLHIVRSFLPSSMLVVLSWASFWVPPTSYPARVGLVTTCFLTSMILYQHSITTAVEYLTAMQIYMMGNITFIAIALLEFIVTLQRMKTRRNK